MTVPHFPSSPSSCGVRRAGRIDISEHNINVLNLGGALSVGSKHETGRHRKSVGVTYSNSGARGIPKKVSSGRDGVEGQRLGLSGHAAVLVVVDAVVGARLLLDGTAAGAQCGGALSLLDVALLSDGGRRPERDLGPAEALAQVVSADATWRSGRGGRIGHVGILL